MHAAVAVMLGLNGLRVSEACGANIEDLAVQRGHRALAIVGKGNKPAFPLVHPHMSRAGFIMAPLDAGVPRRDVQLAARHADPRTTTIYDRRRENFDRHDAYIVVAFVAGG
jgi:integrase